MVPDQPVITEVPGVLNALFECQSLIGEVVSQFLPSGPTLTAEETARLQEFLTRCISPGQRLRIGFIVELDP